MTWATPPKSPFGRKPSMLVRTRTGPSVRHADQAVGLAVARPAARPASRRRASSSWARPRAAVRAAGRSASRRTPSSPQLDRRRDRWERRLRRDDAHDLVDRAVPEDRPRGRRPEPVGRREQGDVVESRGVDPRRRRRAHRDAVLVLRRVGDASPGVDGDQQEAEPDHDGAGSRRAGGGRAGRRARRRRRARRAPLASRRASRVPRAAPVSAC